MKSALTNIAYPILAALAYPLHGDVWFVFWMAVMAAGSFWMHYDRHRTGKWRPVPKAADYAGMFAVFWYLIWLEPYAAAIAGVAGFVAVHSGVSDRHSQAAVGILGGIVGLVLIVNGGWILAAAAGAVIGVGQFWVKPRSHAWWHIVSAVGTVVLRLAR